MNSFTAPEQDIICSNPITGGLTAARQFFGSKKAQNKTSNISVWLEQILSDADEGIRRGHENKTSLGFLTTK